MGGVNGFRTLLHVYRERLRSGYVKGRVSEAVFEFVSFGIKQAWACIFAGALLALIIATFLFYPSDAPLARYDFLFFAALALQVGLLLSGLETLEEARVILVFHIVGTAMEIFKTAQGSWMYPDHSLIRIGEVPLFSGFMYAAVGSYIARAWRVMDLEFDRFPPLWLQAVLALAIYVNFFSHHFGPDIRIALFVASVLIYSACIVRFRPDERHRPMPLVIGFILVAGFIWIAENLATFGLIWVYPNQDEGWQPVSLQKFGSWYLLMIISFVLVALVHRQKGLSS